MKNYEEFESKSYENSVWQNPTEHTVTVRIWRGPETSQKPWLYLSVPPGEERPFPSEYDDAIHTLDKNGVIVGGKAPQLKKRGENYHLDPVLDTNLQNRKRAIDEAARYLADRSVAEQAAMLAAAQIKAAEEAQAAGQRLQEKIASDKKTAVKELQDRMIEEKLAKK